MQKILSIILIFVISITYMMGMSTSEEFKKAINEENITEIKDILASKKVNIDVPIDFNYNTALMIAVKENKIKMAEELLRLGASVNQIKNFDKDTALTLAIEAGNLPMVQTLLEKSMEDIDIDRTDEPREVIGDKIPLIVAIKKENIDIIKAILNEVPNPELYSAINYAKEIKNPALKDEIIGLLETAQKQYALYECAWKFKDCSDSNFTPAVLAQTITNSERNPLFVAINAGAEGNTTAVEQFVKKGINLNQIVRGGITPLMRAARESRYDMIKLFLQNGADPSAKSKQGKTALDMLKEGIIPTTPYYREKYDSAVGALTQAEARWKKTEPLSPRPKLFDSMQNFIHQLDLLKKALE